MRVNNPQSERPCQTLLPGGLLVSSGLPGGIQNRAEADAIKEATDRKLDFQGDRIREGFSEALLVDRDGGAGHLTRGAHHEFGQHHRGVSARAGPDVVGLARSSASGLVA